MFLKLEDIKIYLKQAHDYMKYAEEEDFQDLEELFQSDEIEEFPFLSDEEHRYRQNMSHSLVQNQEFSANLYLNSPGLDLIFNKS